MKAQITLRSGAQITVDATEFTTEMSIVQSNRIHGMTWTTPPGASARLHYVDLEEVVAVVAIYEEGDR